MDGKPDGFAELIKAIARRGEESQPHNDTDYIDEASGLLYCGLCHTPKQSVIELFGEKTKVPVNCECERRKQEALERREQQRKDMEFIQKLRSRSLMDEKFASQTFETFRVQRQNEKILRLCKRYAEGFDEMLKKNQGLLLYGDVGTGKTFSAACIANALLERRVPVVMTSFVKLLETTKDFNGDDDKTIRQLNKAKLLIIDDLGAERGSDYALERVYDIVDSRYRASLPMILTTNLDLSEMQTTTDIRRSRIYDRIFEVCYPVKFTGVSFRKTEANRRFEEMRKFMEGDGA